MQALPDVRWQARHSAHRRFAIASGGTSEYQKPAACAASVAAATPALERAYCKRTLTVGRLNASTASSRGLTPLLLCTDADAPPAYSSSLTALA